MCVAPAMKTKLTDESLSSRRRPQRMLGRVAQFCTVAFAASLASLGVYVALDSEAAHSVARGTTASAEVRTVTRAARRADFGGESPSPEARHIADWVADSGDNRGMPFVIVDKANGRVFVFSPAAAITGAAPALLGLARGDDSVPGIGEREMSAILPEERTTPAGRFIAERGRNYHGEDIVWIDYDAAVSMHRVRATNPAERRLQRLASSTADDNRISYGCINVPVDFFDRVVAPAFSATNGVVYVLPETRSAQTVFGSYDVATRARSASLRQPFRGNNL